MSKNLLDKALVRHLAGAVKHFAPKQNKINRNLKKKREKGDATAMPWFPKLHRREAVTGTTSEEAGSSSGRRQTAGTKL